MPQQQSIRCLLLLLAWAPTAPSLAPTADVSRRSSRRCMMTTTAAPDTVARRPPHQRLGALYQKASKEHHIQLAALQAGVLGGGSDAVSMTMHGLSPDVHHVAAMTILAAVLSGACNAKWLEWLESAVPGASQEAVLAKTTLDYCIAGVLANSAYLIGVPAITALLSGASCADVLATGGWTPESFRDVMLIEACTFGPYNLLAFKLVPPRLRPLSAATVSASCAIALSGVTLGFGL